MSMIHSLEARTPMLDLEVIENAFRIPFNMKVKYGRTKYLLRKSMKGILPDSIINKKKWGFAYNPNTLLNVNLKEHADNILSKENIDRVGILEYNTIKKILDHKPTNKMRWHYFFTLMALFFVIWHKTFIEGDFREYRPRIEDYY